VRGASRRFGAIRALDGVSLDLPGGEIVGLLGLNGAGKSTLIGAIAGRVRLDSGSVEVRGARIGLVPQQLAHYPMLTARENLEVFASLHGLSGARRRDRVGEALDWAGLAERADEPVERFSGGMRRRLDIGCGVVHGPDVVLLDEPTVGVDPCSRDHIWTMLAGLRAGGAALLVATHQLEEAERACDRFVVLDRGRTLAAGRLAELLSRTVGRRRLVTIRLDRPPPGRASRNRSLRVSCEDLASELPALLASLRDGGCRVEDLAVELPDLAAVFLHLTGEVVRS
jgi:ABC-2 type transport system ATP-binding protein